MSRFGSDRVEVVLHWVVALAAPGLARLSATFGLVALVWLIIGWPQWILIVLGVCVILREVILHEIRRASRRLED